MWWHFQVQFKEGSFQPPKIKSNISLPENVDIFGQNINLSPVQQSLNPLQEAVANLAGVISGQPPLKIAIPGERSSSWLLISFLDKDLRISRGDGGLFVLAKEGSPLLDQWSGIVYLNILFSQMQIFYTFKVVTRKDVNFDFLGPIYHPWRL